MGALFHIRHQYFSSFEDYTCLYPNHSFFPFMLTGAVLLEQASSCPLFSLIFGNEASGLDESFSRIGQSVKIPLSGDVDSFNLSVAVGIGLYAFTKEYNLSPKIF
ncbi:MAG: TrmH family RNA methyltransferase [Eubacteriales bacterium]